MLAGSRDHQEEERGPSWTALPLAYRYQPEALVQPAQLEAETLTGDRDRMTTGSSAPAATHRGRLRPVPRRRPRPHLHPYSQQVENLDRRSSYTCQLEALRSRLRGAIALPFDPTTP